MAGYVEIPTNMLGQAFSEIELKGALWRLNSEFHFDFAGNHNIWHPYQDGKQGVYWRGKHLCSMDRGNIPQAPIWQTIRKGERVHVSDMTWAELQDPMAMNEIEYLVDGTERKTDYWFVKRQVKDRLLWIGWQATLRKICNHDIPGVTAATLGDELGITLDLLRNVEDCEVAENRTHLYDHKGRSISI